MYLRVYVCVYIYAYLHTHTHTHTHTCMYACISVISCSIAVILLLLISVMSCSKTGILFLLISSYIFKENKKIKEYIYIYDGISGNGQRKYALTKITNLETLL